MNIENENKKLLIGKKIKVLDKDDHIEHIKLHNDLSKNVDFVKNRLYVMNIVEHILQHMMT